MKRIAFFIYCLWVTHVSMAQPVPDSIGQRESKDSFYLLSPVEVRALRANENAPFAITNLFKKDIQKLNLGQDLPFLFNQTPSVVVNADAGTGIGYTGIRIRGTDATRINVTLNGIPYNDQESQGTFFVDLPDFASSIGSIQIQRGVGTSSNGAGAFGASINFSTNEINKQAYGEVNNSVGSFNTWKNTLKAGTGLIGNHFTADARLSSITSDGFIDRAKSKLRSLYFSTAWLAKNSSVRFNMILGKEKTYQAWNGISETDLKNGLRRINYAGMEKPGGPYNNETDNYRQDHFQLFFNQSIGEKITFNTAFFYTPGKGYYEQYKANEDYATYNLPYPMNGATPVAESDFIRQLWLDNDFYGNIFSLQYKRTDALTTWGGGYSKYLGNHFGKLLWASNGITGPDKWYDLDAEKKDFHLYIKEQKQFNPHWSYFIDVQYRHVNYQIDGFRDHPDLSTDHRYDFFNPKAGMSFRKNGWKGFFSYSIANKEPNRNDFEAGILQQPKPERLHDVELGIEKTKPDHSWSATAFYMKYKDQLVPTGKINDVGAYTRTNIPKSYRLGLELTGMRKFNKWISGSANLSLSKNKVIDFIEYIDDYDNGGQKLNRYRTTDIAFSPTVIAAASLHLIPVKYLEVILMGKSVSRQYLDNTEKKSRSLDPFYVQDLQIVYTIRVKRLKEINITGRINNLFNEKYEPNGYTYNYISGGSLVVENYYFPMAGTNLMLALNIRL